MEQTINRFGEKSEEYPQGYGYCQCGCGKLAPKLTNGMSLHFIARHNPNKLKIKGSGTVKIQRFKEISLRSEYRSERWSLKYEKCIKCGTTEIPHWARGYCNRCYPKYVIRKTAEFDRSNKEKYSNFLNKVIPRISEKQRVQRSLPVQIKQQLSKDLLRQFYYDKRMSLGDIAKQYNCSRVYIARLCIEYGIQLKTKSKAREDARCLGKNVRYHAVDKGFFKTWSNEMAYVLGFFCADGNIGPRLDVLSFSQKEIDILLKIKKIMNADQKITHYKHQDINFLAIGSSEMVEDLLRLGITPHKSLRIKFPKMPPEYTRHFLRGNFDGDGSICRQGSGWKVVFLSGSKDFLVGVKENIEEFAGLKEATLYKHKDANAYTCSYHSKDNITKIFNFLYDEYTLQNELYLKRKYFLFREAIKGFNAGIVV